MRKIITLFIALLLPVHSFAGSIVTTGTGGSIVTSGFQIGNGTGNTDYVEFTAAASVFGTGSTVGWTNPTNALTSLATFANANSVDGGDYTYYLHVTNASAALAELQQTSSIDGIEVELSATGDDGGSDYMEVSTVQLIIGGTRVGTNKAGPNELHDISIQTYTYGGAADLWGLTPTKEELMASDFGVAIRILSDGGSTANAEIYRVRIKVYYSGSVGSVVTE